MAKSRIIRGRRQYRFSKTKSILAFIIVFGMIFGMGAMTMFITYHEVVGAFASSSWPSVNGTIISSEVKITEDRPTSSSPRQSSYSYQADIKYEYDMDGGKLIGDRVRFGEVSNKEIAESLVVIYKPGDKVQVYYDPGNPENSVLEPGLSFGLLLMPLLGLAVIGAGIIGVVIFFKFFWDR